MSATIWVGEFQAKALVYDPAIQLADCPHLFLWNPTTSEMGKYIANMTRKPIKPHGDPRVASTCIAAYRQWKDAYGTAWLQEEKRYYEARRARELAQEADRRAKKLAQDEARQQARLTLEERHRSRLEKLGKAYLGVRPAIRRHLHRITHCYACKRGLDNSVDIECVACDWILCTCGACGCGYSGLV